MLFIPPQNALSALAGALILVAATSPFAASDPVVPPAATPLQIPDVASAAVIDSASIEAAAGDADRMLLAQNLPASEPRAGQQAVQEPSLSEAERIARLQRALETDRKALEEIKARLADPQSEYHKAEGEFQGLDARLEASNKRIQELEENERRTEAEELQKDLAKLEKQWKLAKDRFEIAIQERKTTQEKADNLAKQIQQNRGALDKLTGTLADISPTAPAPAANIGESPRQQELSVEAQPPVASSSPPDQTTAAPAAASTSVEPPAAAPPENEAATPPTEPPVPEPAKRVDKELQQATEEAQLSEAAALTAEEEAESVAERMESLQRDVELERKLLATARKKADNAEAAQSGLEEEFRTNMREGSDDAALRDVQARLSDARRRFREARAEGRERSARLDELQSRYAALQSEEIVAMRQADAKRKEANSAREKVDQLRNPFTARNTLQWLIDHGPRMMIILAAMAGALCVSRVFERRIVDTMVSRGGLGKRAERENRARTLVSVFHNAANVAIIGGGAIMILDIVGAPITALMGGAAVFGLAVAFGDQNLIKDYFYGFMILMEQQYTINDVVRIGDIAGQVERITLRMTVLRDLEGRVHFVPHGQINSTTNMTHGWSRAVFDIGVAYKEDVDRVIALITQIGGTLREDPQFGPLILEDLTMLGLDAFGDSAIVIKFFIKTRPLKQWDVKREMLRRIKRTFDEQGIEIPFPHRTVYHRHEEAEAGLPENLSWTGRKSA